MQIRSRWLALWFVTVALVVPPRVGRVLGRHQQHLVLGRQWMQRLPRGRHGPDRHTQRSDHRGSRLHPRVHRHGLRRRLAGPRRAQRRGRHRRARDRWRQRGRHHDDHRRRCGRAEITHTGPKSAMGGVTTFSFLWTAPSSFSSVTLQAWGNAVNGNISTHRRPRRAVDPRRPQLDASRRRCRRDADAGGDAGRKLGDPLPRPIRRGAKDRAAAGRERLRRARSRRAARPASIRATSTSLDQSGILVAGRRRRTAARSSSSTSRAASCPSVSSERARTTSAASSAPPSIPATRTNGLVYTYTSEPTNGAADFSTQPPTDARPITRASSPSGTSSIRPIRRRSSTR